LILFKIATLTFSVEISLKLLPGDRRGVAWYKGRLYRISPKKAYSSTLFRKKHVTEEEAREERSWQIQIQTISSLQQQELDTMDRGESYKVQATGARYRLQARAAARISIGDSEKKQLS